MAACFAASQLSHDSTRDLNINASVAARDLRHKVDLIEETYVEVLANSTPNRIGVVLHAHLKTDVTKRTPRI